MCSNVVCGLCLAGLVACGRATPSASVQTPPGDLAADSPAAHSCIAVESHADRPAQQVWHSSQFGADQPELLRRTDEAMFRSLEAQLSAPVVETHALIEARAYDATGRPVPNFRLELWSSTDTGYRYCSDCRAWYPGRTREHPSRVAAVIDPAAWLLVVPRNAALFIARDVHTQRPLSVIGPVDIRPGRLRLVFGPISAQQLAALPDAVRRL
jgi:hypothetical protein